MAKVNYIKVFIAVVIAILLCIAGFILFLNSSIRSSVKEKMITTREGVSLLNSENYSIFASYNGFYKLDEKGEWKLLIPDIQGDHHQEVYLCDEYLYFFELEDYTIKRAPIGNANKIETVTKAELSPGYIGVSKDKENLAYSNDEYVFVYSKTSNKTEKYQLPSYIHSIAWPEDEGKLFLGTSNGIYKLLIPDGTYEKICDGTWVFVLPDNNIGYFDKKKYVCCKYDLKTKEETFLFKVETSTIGMDWSEDGKYILTAHRDVIDLIRWGIWPVLHRVSDGKELGLPVFKIYTGCVFIKKNKD
jgi:hypothetical protein